MRIDLSLACQKMAGLVVLLGISSSALGQQASTAPSVDAAVANLRQAYTASFTAHPQLFNGPEYINYARRYHAQVGHQFFLAPEPQRGTAFYNEHLFEDLQLQYDVVLDQLVLTQSSNPLQLRLVNEKTRAFTIGEHRFTRLIADSTQSKLTTGYYEVLAQGNIEVVARRAKRQQEQIRDRALDVEFVTNDKLYAHKNGVYYSITSKSAAMRLFTDKAPEIQAYLRENKIKFRKAQLESTLVALANYYNRLPAR